MAINKRKVVKVAAIIGLLVGGVILARKASGGTAAGRIEQINAEISRIRAASLSAAERREIARIRSETLSAEEAAQVNALLQEREALQKAA